MEANEWIDLTCHRATHSNAVRSLRASVRRTGAGLAISFRFEGDLSSLHVPAPTTPGIGKELWRHTCFEAFIAIEGRAAYHEFNFAPSGEWTIYGMRGYRDGAPLADESMRPEIVVRSTATQLELDAAVHLDRLSDEHARAPLRVGLYAVIEADDGFSYWALMHPASKPDFHNSQGFILRLEPTG
ncbi:MAG TPA: DOMON-like domain-containing protein [Candidatus Binataceae bacterium]|nr:DOMON-like domain-containing protein [Candidatus Binataceae bacterium]